jgi:hypothetical protein
MIGKRGKGRTREKERKRDRGEREELRRADIWKFSSYFSKQESLPPRAL